MGDFGFYGLTDSQINGLLSEVYWRCRALPRQRRFMRRLRPANAAGLRPLRFHTLRYAAGSLIARHADACFVQEFLGHSRDHGHCAAEHWELSVGYLRNQTA